MANTKVVRIGVFVPGEVQLLDLSCIDIFHMMSREYLGLESMDLLPKHLRDLAPSVEISYITSAGYSPSASETKLLPITSNLRIAPTHDIAHPDVQPGRLHILLVPGPDPGGKWEEDVLEFLRAHAEREETDVLSVCGITNGNDLVAAYARRNSKHFPGPVAEIACSMADVGDRGQFYGEGQTVYFLGVVWQVVKAWFVRPGKAKGV
ncbi:hypothetical protein K4K53_000724 [Colletotrichum sp. SAR 10_77]|nr:hypothetical protein K4K52_002599 [Colletotrichum sp. SAR 10_76]KAI8248549.1 hypothetical protein K4K53_000724 [Colletotrichum sp. SAR 10_77]